MRNSVSTAPRISLIFYLVFSNVNFSGSIVSTYYTYTDMLTYKYYKKKNNDYNKQYCKCNLFYCIFLIIFCKVGKFLKFNSKACISADFSVIVNHFVNGVFSSRYNCKLFGSCKTCVKKIS